MSPQSSVAFHPAVLIVVLRWYASNKLIFRRHASKNPGGLGAEPPRSMGSNSKTFRFSNRLSCLSPRRSLLPRQSPGAKGGQAFYRYRELSCVKARGRRGAKRMGGGIKQQESRVTKYAPRLSAVGRRFHPKISAGRSGYLLRNLRLLSSWTRRIHIATE